MGDNVDYGALFGLEGTEAEGAGENGQETADTAGSAQDKDQTSAEDKAAEEENENEGDASAAGEGSGDGKPAQTAEENSRYAAARRKAEAERDLAVQKAREEVRAQMQEEINASIKSLGMVNPYTKEPIVDKAGLDAYKQKFDVEKKARFAKKAGMSEQEFEAYINDLPEVRSAREQAKAAEDAQKAVQAERAKAEIDRQIEEIRQLDPSIQSISDLTRMPDYKRFYELVKRGNTLTDAFRLVNLDRQTDQVRGQAKQAALNQVASKSHLDRTTTRGAGSVTVPADVIAEYRAFNPDASDEEIRKHWAKYQKR